VGDKEKQLTKNKAYCITCSADSIDLDARSLFVWGGYNRATWLPKTMAEMRKRLEMCRRENKCNNCDAEIHEIVIERTKLTLRQMEHWGKSAKEKEEYKEKYYQENKDRISEYNKKYRQKL